jgi:hypothetical protein
MIDQDPIKQDPTTPKRSVKGESVLAYVVIASFMVAAVGVFRAVSSSGWNDPGLCLIASALALGVVAYIYSHKS